MTRPTVPSSSLDEHGTIGRIRGVSYFSATLIAVLCTGLCGYVILGGGKWRQSGSWKALLKLVGLVLVGGIVGSEVGLWYGGVQYQHAMEREGLIGKLLTPSSQEQLVRDYWGGVFSNWGVLAGLGVANLLARWS